MTMADFVLPLVQALGAALTAILVAVATQWLRQKNIDLSIQQQQQLERAIRLGVSFAEEQARRRLKAGVPISSADKQQLATDFVQEKLPTAKRREIEGMIGAVLPELRQTTLPGATPSSSEHP